jgi:hypothetical protein
MWAMMPIFRMRSIGIDLAMCLFWALDPFGRPSAGSSFLFSGAAALCDVSIGSAAACMVVRQPRWQDEPPEILSSPAAIRSKAA